MYVGMHVYMYVCYSYTIGASGLPDIHEGFSLR